MAFTITLAGGNATTLAAGGPHSSPGRTYSGNAVTVDSASNDASDLQAAGWVVLSQHKGPTAQRPTADALGNAILPGFRYLDTTLTKVIVRGASAWLDPVTGAAV